MKKYLFIIFILISNLSKADNYVTISPSSQSSTVESDTEETFYFSVYCGYTTYNNDITYLTISNPNNTDGFLNLSGNYGSLHAGSSSGIIVKFKKSVNTTTTIRYDFNCSWYTPNQQFGFGSDGFTVLITYVKGCIPNITITQNVNSGQTDIQESSNIITAKNTIFSNATAEYDAGNIVYLKPNFHAKYGSNFRAFIEGCHGTKNSKKVNNVSSNNTNLIAINKEELIKVFPNPTKNTVTIEGSKEVDSWVVTNTYGKSYFNGNNTKSKIDMTNLPNGIYFLKAILTNGKVVTKTIIKN